MSYSDPSAYPRSVVRLQGDGGPFRRTADSDSRQYIHHLASMLHGEPVVERCLMTIVSGTLAKGITVMSSDGTRMATPEFNEFVNKHYQQFSQHAIRMFFVLGFVVWHIARRQIEGKLQYVPEVLPLGTFTWSIKTRDSDRQDTLDEPLVQYDVHLQGVECDFHVFEFVTPNLTMQCVSPLAAVIPRYLRLQITRAAKMKCDEWNASVRVAIENVEKLQANQMADDGAALNTASCNPHFDTLYEDTLGESTEARAVVAREQAAQAAFPPNTHLFVLPKNHSTRALEPVEHPKDVPETEIEFQREVCYALGVPISLVLQIMQAGVASTKVGSTNDATRESTQLLRNTCTAVAEALCCLLREVYECAYAGEDDECGVPTAPSRKRKRERVTFSINCTPTLALGDIIELHFREFVEDDAINAMLKDTIGYPLNSKAERLPYNRTVDPPTDAAGIEKGRQKSAVELEGVRQTGAKEMETSRQKAAVELEERRQAGAIALEAKKQQAPVKEAASKSK